MIISKFMYIFSPSEFQTGFWSHWCSWHSAWFENPWSRRKTTAVLISEVITIHIVLLFGFVVMKTVGSMVNYPLNNLLLPDVVNMSLPSSFSSNGRGKYRPKLPCPAKQRMLQYRSNHLSMSENCQQQRFVSELASHSESKICSEYSNDSNTSSEQRSSSQCLDDAQKDADQGTFMTRISIDTGAIESSAQSSDSKLGDLPDAIIQDSPDCTDIGFDDYSKLTRYVSRVRLSLDSFKPKHRGWLLKDQTSATAL